MGFKTKEEAETEGKKWLATLPDGWELEVWGNMGFHFRLLKGLIAIYYDHRGTFYTMIRKPGDSVGVGCCEWQDHTGGYYSTPKEAARKASSGVFGYFRDKVREQGTIAVQLLKDIEGL